MERSGPIGALIDECEARSDRRDLPIDVVEQIASALADAIVAELSSHQNNSNESGGAGFSLRRPPSPATATSTASRRNVGRGTPERPLTGRKQTAKAGTTGT